MSRGIRAAPPEVQEMIETWDLRGDTPEEIARRLNECGCTTPRGQPWNARRVSSQLKAIDEAFSEQDLLLEQSEDKRLRRLGIDPDADPIDIMLQIFEMAGSP